MVLNTSLGLITFPVAGDPSTPNISFIPGLMKSVSKAQWEDMNKRPQMKKYLDEGVLVTGKEAKVIDTNTRKEIEERVKKENEENNNSEKLPSALDEDEVDEDDVTDDKKPKEQNNKGKK